MPAEKHPQLYTPVQASIEGNLAQHGPVSMEPAGKADPPTSYEYADLSGPSPKDTEADADEDFDPAVEAAKLPHWRRQITLRALLTGAVLGILFSIVQQKLGLQAGVAPGFGLAACIVGFGIIKFVVVPSLMQIGLSNGFYYPQETTIIQTMTLATMDLSWAGGFHSFLVSLSKNFIGQFAGSAGVGANDVYEPTLGRTIPYQLCICFIGIFVVIIIRKAIVIDFRLPFPTPTASGVLIKSLHTKTGAAEAKKRLKVLGLAFVVAFCWKIWQFFFQGDEDCTGGFASFPTLGLAALDLTWYFDFELTYVGIGMLVPPIVSASMMLGAIVVYGIVLPLAHKHSGDWYPPSDELTGSKDVRGPYGYQVFIALAFFLGEGAYTIVKVLFLAGAAFYRNIQAKRTGQEYKGGHFVGRPPARLIQAESERERRLSEYVFLSNPIPWWVCIGGYIVFTIIGSATIPQLYKPAKWYYCLVIYLVAPFFAIINAYCCGMTDWDITSAWSTLAVFIVGAWAGRAGQPDAVVAALVMSGIAGAAVNASAGIMGDYKTGYYTLVHPRALLATQLIGETLGIVMAPIIFFYLYYNVYDLGVDKQYPVPQAAVNLAAAVVSVEGTKNLPKHCMEISAICFFMSIALPMFRDFGPTKLAKFTPVPMGMGIPLVVGAWLAIDMCMGSALTMIWSHFGFASAQLYLVPIATGIISGEGIWSIPEAILTYAKATGPICMLFVPKGAASAALDAAGMGS